VIEGSGIGCQGSGVRDFRIYRRGAESAEFRRVFKVCIVLCEVTRQHRPSADNAVRIPFRDGGLRTPDLLRGT
jgi:hypothetical protein